jgi:FAD/FMN-containing dehydrogenase
MCMQVEGFEGEFSNEADALALASKDASAFVVPPQGIFYPTHEADIAALVRYTSKERQEGKDVSLTVRAGGTCMSGGALNSGYIVDMTKHMSAIHINPDAMTADVEMGAYFRDIEDAAAQHDLIFPAYPSSRKICGIGGMIGNNASGEKSLRNGPTLANVLSLRMVCADGTIRNLSPYPYREVREDTDIEVLKLHTKHAATFRRAVGDVVKSASGYRLDMVLDRGVFSLLPLIVGAQGTLGIVTRATLKLIPTPKQTSLIVISAHTLTDVAPIVAELHKHNPEGLETFDQNTFAQAKIHLEADALRFSRAVLPDAKLFILAQFSEETHSGTIERSLRAAEALTKRGYHSVPMHDPEDVQSAWNIRRNSFLLMRDYNPPRHRAIPCIEDVIVPLPVLGVFIADLVKILERRHIFYGFHGHIGDGSLRIIPVFDMDIPTVDRDIIDLTTEVFALVKRLHGNISADHSDGIIRSPFLREFYGDELCDVFANIKTLFDPYNIFNPGKKIVTGIDAISRYLNRS